MSSYVGTDVGIPRIGRLIHGREVAISTVSISRAELYDRVWSEPILKVAKSLGISDVGLAKACRRHDIPTPPRGYWAKKEHGYRPKQTPLPDATKHEEVILHGPLDRNMPNSVYGEATEEPLLAEEQEAARIQVAASLRGAHALVAKANDEMAGAKKDAVGLLIPPDDASLGIRVSRAQLRRALLIMDAILKALNARGYATSAGPVVTIFEQRIAFTISEPLETVRQEPGEHDLDGRYEFGHSRFHTERVPSGRLALHIPEADRYWANGYRKSWRDAKKQKLEDCLNKFVAGLVEVAARQRGHRIAEEQERKQQAEAARRRQEEAVARAERRKLQAAEQARLNGLLQQASDWRTSNDLRHFLDAVRAEHTAGGSSIDPESEIGRWLSWATAHADRLDPLAESPPSILDEVIPEEPKRYSR